MLVKDLRPITESRSEWMLELFQEGGKKQKKKSAMQDWQFNNHAMSQYTTQLSHDTLVQNI